MTKAWVSDGRQRRSKTYIEKHRQLAEELAYSAISRALPNRSAKQIRKFVRSELHRLYGESVN